MKTIRQIAEEVGVSKQAINRKIKREPLATELKRFLVTNGNRIYFEDEGAQIIKLAFSFNHIDNQSATNDNRTTTDQQHIDNQSATNDNRATTDQQHIDNQSATNDNEFIEFLKEQIREKDRQLEIKDIQLAEKDKQIGLLTQTLHTQSQSINADRHADLAELLQENQKTKLITDNMPKPKFRERLRFFFKGSI